MNHVQKKICPERRTHLPDANDSVGDKNEEDDDRFHEGSGWFLSFLKQSQHLRNKGHVKASNTANMEAKRGEWSCKCHNARFELNRPQVVDRFRDKLHRWALFRSYFMILLTHAPMTAEILHFQSADFVKVHLSWEGCKPLTGWAGDKLDQERSEQRLAC